MASLLRCWRPAAYKPRGSGLPVLNARPAVTAGAADPTPLSLAELSTRLRRCALRIQSNFILDEGKRVDYAALERSAEWAELTQHAQAVAAPRNALQRAT